MANQDRNGDEAKVKVVDRRRFVMDEAGDVVERPDAPPKAPRQRPESNVDAQTSTKPGEKPSGSSGPGIAGAPPASPKQAAAPGEQEKPADAEQSSEQKLETQIFLEFLNSLAHSMLIHLGETPDPGSGLVRENLEGAQQTLEILSVLRRKTEGNLNAQEARLFDSLIYELMMRFRQKVEAMPQPSMQRPGGAK